MTMWLDFMCSFDLYQVHPYVWPYDHFLEGPKWLNIVKMQSCAVLFVLKLLQVWEESRASLQSVPGERVYSDQVLNKKSRSQGETG